MTAYLNELSWGVTQEGQVVKDVMQHGRPPGGPRMLQGPLTPVYWPATCIQMFTHAFICVFSHLFVCPSVRPTVRPSVHASTHPSMHSLVHCLFTYSIAHPSIQSTCVFPEDRLCAVLSGSLNCVLCKVLLNHSSRQKNALDCTAEHEDLPD